MTEPDDTLQITIESAEEYELFMEILTCAHHWATQYWFKDKTLADKIIEIKNGNTKTLRINYDLGNICNYKCWYCFPGSNEGTVPWPAVELVKHNIVKLITHYQSNGYDVQLSLLGGEPTLWPNLGEFVEFIVKKIKEFYAYN